MRRNRIAAAALAVLLLGATAGAADESMSTERRHHQPDPGLAIASALLNIVFLPVRLPLTLLGAEFAGLSGFLNAGDQHVADDIFGMVDGTQVITPKVLKGHEPFRVGRYD